MKFLADLILLPCIDETLQVIFEMVTFCLHFLFIFLDLETSPTIKDSIRRSFNDKVNNTASHRTIAEMCCSI